MISTKPDLRSLRDDHDTTEPDGEGYFYRLSVSPDFDWSFNDWDCYGKAEHAERNHHFLGYDRPKGFDGNAELVSHGNDGPWWWQPPADGPKRGTPEFDSMRYSVSSLLAYGCVIVALEKCKDRDAYGEPIVLDYASLGGVEWDMPHEHLIEILDDLAVQLN